MKSPSFPHRQPHSFLRRQLRKTTPLPPSARNGSGHSGTIAWGGAGGGGRGRNDNGTCVANRLDSPHTQLLRHCSFALIGTLLLAASFCGQRATFGQTAGIGPSTATQEPAPTAVTPEAGVTQPPVSAESPDPASQPTGDQVPDEVQWPQDADGWFLVTPEGAGASFAMPVSPRPSDRQMVPVEGTPIHVRMMAAVDELQVNYVFAWHDQKVPQDVTDVKNTLDGAVKGALGSTLGQLESADALDFNGLHGCDFRILFTYKDQPMRVVGRVILVGPRVYQLTCVIPVQVDAEAAVKRFAGSFVHLPEPPPAPSADPATTGTGSAANPQGPDDGG